MSTRIRFRRDTAANWTSANPTLTTGELGYETDTGKFKIGNNTNAWTALPYSITAELSEGNLNDLKDVTITSAANGDFLRWNGTAWVNDAVNLSTDTVGSFVESLVAGTGITLSNNSGEAATPTVAVTANTYDAYGASSTVAGNLTTHANLTEAHGATGAVVGTTNTQTLTNKTLTSPVITTPSITGAVFNDGSLVFEGATADAHETTLAVTDPTADRTITLPDATGTVALLGTIALGTDTTGNYVNDITAGTGVTVTHTPSEGSSPTIAIGQAVATNSNVTFNDLTVSGNLTVSGTTTTINSTAVNVKNQVVFEGATDDNFETTLTVVDPTADRTITFPDATTTVVGTNTTDTLTNKTLTSPKVNEDVVLTSTATELNILDGATLSTTELNYVDGVTSAIQTQLDAKAPLASPTFTGSVTLPDNTVALGTKTTGDYVATITGGTGISSTAATTGEGTAHTLSIGQSVATTDSPTFAGLTVNGASVVFEGATANDFETTLSVTDPTADRTITIPDATGTVALTSDVTTHANLTEAHGATGAVVGTTNTQTLTNKTLTSPKINEDVVLTSTATELNVLDGITSSTAELNILDGVTSSAAELNILDGATLSTTELNYVDGVTSAIQTQIDAKAPIASPTFTGTVTIPTGASITAPTGLVKGDVGLGNVDNTSDANKPVSTAGQTALDLKANLASPTFTGTVTVPTPTNATDAVTKSYADAITQSLDIKDSVRVASTANITIASALTDGSTIDGVVVATGDRVLLKNQSTASQNGVYVVVASGAASRSTDANTSAKVTSGMYVFVSEGTVSADMGYVLTTNDSITLGTTALSFTQFSGAGQITAGTGISKSGNTLSIDTTVTADLTTAQTLTNKTLTSPVVNTPTGIVKGDVGLGNVDNTSNATERAATATLTNKTLTSPVINTPTGIVKGDVGLGNVDNTADSAKPVSTAQQTALDLKANLASPTFTGTPTLPTGTIATTQTAGNSTTAIATTAFVTTAVSGAAITALDDVGDVTITSAASGQFLKWNGTAWVNDAIDLGTDTTGSYVTSLVAGTGVTLTNNSGEGATPTVTVDTSVIQARVANVTDTEIGYLDGVTSAIQTQINSKQATLVSATNIKSINGTSLLGSGDLTVGAAAPTTTSITANTVTTIDSFNKDVANSAEFTVRVDQGGSRFTSSKVLVLHNGTTVDLTQYGELSIAGAPGISGTAAVTWTTRTANFGDGQIDSVAYGNNLWVAGGDTGQLRTSTDAVTWTTRTSNFGYDGINSIAYGNNLWVAGGNNGQLRTSTDAVTWTTQTSTFGSSDIYSVAYGNNLWVAGGYSGQIRTSTDAVTWTTQTSNFGTTFIYSVAYGNNLWVAGGYNGQLRTSTDAVTWTTRTSNFGNERIRSVAYGNNLWVAGGYNGQLRTSTDGTTWTTRTSNFDSSPVMSVAYGSSLWVAGGYTGYIRTSTDAVTWTTQTSTFGTSEIFSVAYGNNLWVAAGYYGLLGTSATSTAPSAVIPLTLSADISGSDVRLRATVTDAATVNATAKVLKTTL